MADTTSPPASAAPSQKRPLEEPSSPSSHGEQPEAKRQALDKVIKEEAANTIPDTKPDQTNTEGQTNGESHTNGQVDTVIPDAPVTAVKTEDQQAIQSTATNVGAVQTPTLASQDESQWLHLRAIISSAEAATVIGKGGENVTIIRNKSGARCTVSDYTRGAVERTLTVSGTTEAVAKVSLPASHPQLC
jgi:poly(rC)-binding protein 2/3/4